MRDGEEHIKKKNLGSKTSSYRWAGQAASLTTADDPELALRYPSPSPAPQAASPLPWERNGVWDRTGEGLREGWRTPPLKHNDNHRDLATVPHWPLDTQPRGPQVSSAHYTFSLHLNSLTPHLHTHHFFVLHSLFLLVCYTSTIFLLLHLIFFSASPWTPPFLLFVFCISSVQST